MTRAPISSALAELASAMADIDGLAVKEGVDLGRLNTFRIGGQAELFAEVRTEDGLSTLLERVNRLRVPFFLLGIGSNVLIPDEGVEGVVAKLAGDLDRIEFDGVKVKAGGAVSLSKLARESVRRGLLGLEALAGFPSTVGGAVRMNAGSYGAEIQDVLIEARIVDRRGRIRSISVDDLGAGYRTTMLQTSGDIVTEARFVLSEGDGEAASLRIKELNRRRWQSLPSGVAHVGSIFRNPETQPAGKLIEECGLKGEAVGGAQVSPKHGNVIVNTGGATARDVLDLMVLAHAAVAEKFQIALEPEVVLVGELQGLWEVSTRSTRKKVALAGVGNAS